MKSPALEAGAGEGMVGLVNNFFIGQYGSLLIRVRWLNAHQARDLMHKLMESGVHGRRLWKGI